MRYFVITSSVLPNRGYDPEKEFTGVAQVAIMPALVVTRLQSTLWNFADFLATARDGNVNVSASQ